MLSQKLIPLIFTGLILTLATSCGDDKKAGKTIKGTARVGELSSTKSPLNPYISALMSNPTFGPPSDDDYAPAKVDGIRIKLISISGISDGNNVEFARPNKVLELSAGTNNISIEEEIDVQLGSYTEAAAHFENNFEVKAFCRTKNKCLYTTETGIKAVASCDETTPLPSDYGYYQYDFLYVTNNEPTAWEGYKLNFNITEDSTPNLFLLIDTYNIVSCWDGIDPSNPKMPPFSWNRNGDPATEDPLRFGNGAEGHFGVSYIPIFTYLGEDENDIPYAQTYLVADEAIKLDGKHFLTTTFAVDKNDHIIAGRSRILYDHANHGTGLEQGWTIGKRVGTQYTLFNGEHRGEFQRWSRTREIKNFELFDGTKQFTVADGDECEVGHDRHPCLETSINTFWKKVIR